MHILPQEVEVWYIIPTIRKLMAQHLIEKYSFSYEKTGRALGVSKAAVSQYVHEKRKKLVSLITGASSGLGKEITVLLCKKGHKIYAIARDEEKLKKLKEECKNYSGELFAVKGDLTDQGFRKRLVEKVLSREKKIDFLFNNAGFGNATKFEKQDIEQAK